MADKKPKEKNYLAERSERIQKAEAEGRAAALHAFAASHLWYGAFSLASNSNAITARSSSFHSAHFAWHNTTPCVPAFSHLLHTSLRHFMFDH